MLGNNRTEIVNLAQNRNFMRNFTQVSFIYLLCPITLQKVEKKILVADPEIQAFVSLSHNTATISHFAKTRMFSKLNLMHFD